jgi:hypothetical protein
MFGGVPVADFDRGASACSEVTTSEDITAQSATDREDASAPRNNFFVELGIVRPENLRAEETISANQLCRAMSPAQANRADRAPCVGQASQGLPVQCITMCRYRGQSPCTAPCVRHRALDRQAKACLSNASFVQCIVLAQRTGIDSSGVPAAGAAWMRNNCISSASVSFDGMSVLSMLK